MKEGMRFLLLNEEIYPVKKFKLEKKYTSVCCTSNGIILSGSNSNEILEYDYGFTKLERINCIYTVINEWEDGTFFAKNNLSPYWAILDFDFKFLKNLDFIPKKDIVEKVHPKFQLSIVQTIDSINNKVGYACIELMSDELLWNYTLEGSPHEFLFFHNYIIIVHTTLGAGQFICLDLKGNLVWSKEEIGFNFSYNLNHNYLVYQASNVFKIIDAKTGSFLRKKIDLPDSDNYRVIMSINDGIYYIVRKGDYTERFGKVNIESLEVEWEYPFERHISNGIKDWSIAFNGKHIINHSYRKGPKIISFDPYSEANIPFRTN